MTLYFDQTTGYARLANNNISFGYEEMVNKLVKRIAGTSNEELSDREIVEYLESKGIHKTEFTAVSAAILNKLQNQILPDTGLGVQYWRQQLDVKSPDELLPSFICIYKILREVKKEERPKLSNVLFRLLEVVPSYSVWYSTCNQQPMLNMGLLLYVLELIHKEFVNPRDYTHRIAENDVLPLLMTMDAVLQKAYYSDTDTDKLFDQMTKLIRFAPPQERGDLSKVLFLFPYWAVKQILEIVIPPLETRHERNIVTVEAPVPRTKSPPPDLSSSPSLLSSMFAGLSRDHLKKSLWIPSIPWILKMAWLLTCKNLEEGQKPKMAAHAKASTEQVINEAETVKWIIEIVDRYTKPEEREQLAAYFEKLDSFLRPAELGRIYITMLSLKSPKTVGAYITQVKGSFSHVSIGADGNFPIERFKASSDNRTEMELIHSKLAMIPAYTIVGIAKELSRYHVNFGSDPEYTSPIDRLPAEDRVELIKRLIEDPENYSKIINTEIGL